MVACRSDEGPPPFSAAVLNSNLGIGENRVLLGLLDEEQGLVADATIEARIYAPNSDPFGDPVYDDARAEISFLPRTIDLNAEHLGGHTTNLEGSSFRAIANVEPRESTAVVRAHEGDLTTAYSAQMTFDQSGFWGLEIDVTVDGKTYEGVRLKMAVLEDTAEPSIGEPAPRSEQLTLDDVDDVATVSSSTQPIREMLDDTIADALDSGRPVVIAFVTPAFCQTRFCGPVLELVVVPMYEEFKERVEFIHVEPYDLERARSTGSLQPVAVVQEWGLLSEPFVFVIDADGMIAAKFEGVMDVAELREAILATLD